MGQFLNFRAGNRRIDLYLPEGRSRQPRPLLILADGHNAFFPKHSSFGSVWEADLATEEVGAEFCKPVVAAVWHQPGRREAEYLPEAVVRETAADCDLASVQLKVRDLAGDEYLDTLVSKVLPAVVRKSAEAGVKVRSDRDGVGLCGASAGAFVSVYGVAQRPDVFGAAMGLSMPWIFGGSQFIRSFVDYLPEPSVGARFWVDHGTADYDRTYAKGQVVADRLVTKRGYQWPQYSANRYIGWGHNERAWAARLPEVLRWWLEGMAS